jgi:hypothetical protein
MKRSFVLNVNERRERIVLLKRTEKNVRTKRSFEKNGCPTLLYIDFVIQIRSLMFVSIEAPMLKKSLIQFSLLYIEFQCLNLGFNVYKKASVFKFRF